MMTPVSVAGRTPFTILNVWAKPKPAYVRHILKTLDLHAEALRAGPVVILGDFNSSPSINGKQRCEFSGLAGRLREEFGLVSAYHQFHGLELGDPREVPTYYHWPLEHKPFHIDYCFVPLAWANRVTNARVCSGRPWSTLSDHQPVLVDVDLTPVRT
jgi:endonuclease/exonuclease/phosphatase family metal-dependent hydrolase